MPILSLLALAVSLASVVRRGEEGRRLTADLERLDAETAVVADRILAERARIETLTSLERIERAAAPLGLRQAMDAELVQVRADEGGLARGGSDVEG